MISFPFQTAAWFHQKVRNTGSAISHYNSLGRSWQLWCRQGWYSTVPNTASSIQKATELHSPPVKRHKHALNTILKQGWFHSIIQCRVIHFPLAKVALAPSCQNLPVANCSRVSTFKKVRLKGARFKVFCGDYGFHSPFLTFEMFSGSHGHALSLRIINNACFMFNMPLGTKLLKCFTNISGSICRLYNFIWKTL